MTHYLGFRRIVILIIGFLLVTIVSSFSYAYWASNVEPVQDSSIGDVSIGTWTPCIFVSTAQEFFDFATSSTSQTDDNYCLANDIDFNGFTWTFTSAHASNIFRGTFDGKGHSLNNIALRSTSTVNNTPLSLFATLDGATIKDVTINDFRILVDSSYFNSSSFGAGIFGGSVNGNPVLFEDIRINNADVVCNTINGCGGLNGQIEANTNVTYRNIKIRGLTVLSSSRRVGSLFSRLNTGTGTVIVEDVDIISNLAAIGGNTNTGGLAGTVRNANFIVDRAIVEFIAQGSVDLIDTTLNYTNAVRVGGFIGNDNNNSVIVMNDAFFTGELYDSYTNAGSVIGRSTSSVSLNEVFYSNVLFVSSFTPTSNSGPLQSTVVNATSLPNQTWWNGFSDDFDMTDIWQQDGTGRLVLID
jgi:hypothetical protein